MSFILLYLNYQTVSNMTATTKNALNVVLAAIERLEAKQWNFTITFEESVELQRLITLAESLIK